MRNIFRFSLAILCCLIEVSCSFEKQHNLSVNTNRVIKINNDKIRNIDVLLDEYDCFNDLDEYLNTTTYVKLAPEPLLAPLKRVQITNNHIYVLDRMNRFVCYDLQGKVLYQIYAIGNGPGEYAGINTFAMDTRRNELILYDDLKTSLFVYSLDKGTYIRTEPLLKPNPSEIVFHQQTFFYNNRHHNNYTDDSLLHHSLLASNNKYIIDKVCFPHDKFEENYIFSPSLQTFNVNGDTLYYCKNFDSKVYHICLDSIITCYDIKLPNPLPKSKIENCANENDLIRSDYSFGISHIYETHGLLYFRFFNGGYIMNVLYDLVANKQICCVKALQEKFTEAIPIIDIIDGVYKGSFYSVLTPDFIDYKVGIGLQDYSSFFHGYDDETENPVIAFYEEIKKG